MPVMAGHTDCQAADSGNMPRSSIHWTEEEKRNGGIANNFQSPLEAVAWELSSGNDTAAALMALAMALQSLKAVILKASGAVPAAYRTDRQ